jgi:hypothetical protein
VCRGQHGRSGFWFGSCGSDDDHHVVTTPISYVTTTRQM